MTQYDGHVIESTGLIKMDFLGLKTLSELKEACKVVKQTTGDVIDLEKIPIDDELTYKSTNVDRPLVLSSLSRQVCRNTSESFIQPYSRTSSP